MFSRIVFLFRLSKANQIARRYFVTNGFDGVLAILGLLMGFRFSGAESNQIMLSACLGTTIALFMSGITSAYISESAEKKRELNALEQSMIKSLDDSSHADAARLAPWYVALVNGISPLTFSLIILIPLFAANSNVTIFFSPLDDALIIAMALVFFLGVFLGKLSGQFWLWTGIRAVIVAVFTVLIILLVSYFQ